MHAVLRHLEAAGLQGAPRVLGVDSQGREVLTYLDGETAGEDLPWPAWVYSQTALEDVGRWARTLHDATQSFTPPPDARWLAGQAWRPGLIIGHHDAAPWNAVWRDGHLAGFFDWDTAGPQTREFDLAFIALTWVPLHTRGFAERTGFTAFTDRSRRLHRLLDAYGYAGDRTAFGTVVATRARTNAEVIHQMAADGNPAYTALEPIATELAQAAHEIDRLPASFWIPPTHS
ncbi:phosphotransferase [Streptomyces sp. MST-110588]|uniref:phosphotransferase n=1 Tax=Streptomyces sp. MST-110588 TaxID=2833628 RepID=UPI001F5E34FD|nr:phosphotransferase [Streptomyces sp. MST-110588]UNO43600.1 phosphotransferase [Streptomyces sp. MST-110588]